jgi:FKBP-type peptidyl-prolyl cis-trans isomerase 2
MLSHHMHHPPVVNIVEKLTLDLNHPLASETLIFEIEVVGINSTSAQKPMSCSAGCDCSSGCDQ